MQEINKSIREWIINRILNACLGLGNLFPASYPVSSVIGVLLCRSDQLQFSWKCLIMGRSRTSPQLRPWGTPAPWLAPATRTPPPSTMAPSPSHQTRRTRRKKTARSDSSWPEEAIRVSTEITVFLPLSKSSLTVFTTDSRGNMNVCI